MDRVRDSARLGQNLVVPEPQQLKALAAQETVTTDIILAVGMLRSVSLDNKAPAQANEIYNIGLDDLLPLELERGETAIAQHRP